MFEVGRRFRIMNPDRMRSTYGMLVYMLMDSADSQIQDLLEFQCVRPLRTVYSLLGADHSHLTDSMNRSSRHAELSACIAQPRTDTHDCHIKVA